MPNGQRAKQRAKRSAKRRRQREKQKTLRQQAAEAEAKAEAERRYAQNLSGSLQDARMRLPHTSETRDKLDYLVSDLQTRLSLCQASLATAERERAELLRQVQADAAYAEKLEREKISLEAELSIFRAEDRDVRKLHRRLQERADTITKLQRDLQEARSQIPPKPLIYTRPEESVAT